MLKLRTDKGNTHELDDGWKFVEIWSEGKLVCVTFVEDDMVWNLHAACTGKEKDLWEKYVASINAPTIPTTST